jgi:hypothetical protein
MKSIVEDVQRLATQCRYHWLKLRSKLREQVLLYSTNSYRFLLSATRALQDERGDVPGWVLVVLMTTGLVTGIWTLAAPRIDSILRNSLDSMNNIR